MAQALECVEGVGERDAVCQHAHVLLEELDGGLGVRAKVAVHLAAGEPEHIERLLQAAHVVAVEVGKTQVQRAVTHLIALVDEN